MPRLGGCGDHDLGPAISASLCSLSFCWRLSPCSGGSPNHGCRHRSLGPSSARPLDGDQHRAVGLDDRRLDLARSGGARADGDLWSILLRVGLSARYPATGGLVGRRARAPQALQNQPLSAVVFHQVHRSHRAAGMGGPGRQPHRVARPDPAAPPGLCRRHPTVVARRHVSRGMDLFLNARGHPPVVGDDPPPFLPRSVPSGCADGCVRPSRTFPHPP